MHDDTFFLQFVDHGDVVEGDDGHRVGKGFRRDVDKKDPAAITDVY